MATRILIAESSYQEKVITLNANSVFLTLSFNTRDNNWYMDLADRNRVDILTGVKVLPSLKALTDKYVAVRELIGGNIYCVDTKSGQSVISRDNFGSDKRYQLWYLNIQEEEELGL